ncbi:MAG TPA: hypothetical protein VEX38_07650, partial [Fimbriimonadaceae bacterium]|nr:hypothetical protein [Fimbriimonadaceae bacterium]
YRGYRWKHGMLPEDCGSHEHCIGCGDGVPASDFCYYYREDESHLFAPEGYSGWEPPLSKEQIWRLLHPPVVVCDTCFTRLAPQFEWVKVPIEDPDPVYPSRGNSATGP